MKSLSKIALTALVAGLAWSGAAQAYWGLDTTSSTVGDSGNAAYTATMSGYYVSNTLVGGSGANKNLLAGNWSTGTLTDYSGNGQGMTTGTDSGSPYHALDNNGNTEAVLLNFSASTVLTSIGLGYTSNGTTSNCSSGCNGTSGVTVDLSVFRWTGTGAPPSLTGTNAGTMAGWELVGNYGDFGYDTSNPYNLVNSAGKTSSWWLITAYNSGFTQGAQTENRGATNQGDDYFKLYAAAGSKCTSTVDSNGVCGGTTVKLPEPTSLALTSVALFGVAGLRRRKAKAAA